MMSEQDPYREATEAETTGYQLRLIAHILRDILDGNRQDRTKEGLSTDRDTMFLVLPDSLAHFQIENWITSLQRGADIVDPGRFYGDTWTPRYAQTVKGAGGCNNAG